MSNSEPNGATTVLIVEDDPMMQAGLEVALGMLPDLEIVGSAADGVAGVLAAKRLQPDVVLMDIAMPRMDGIEATVQIKRSRPQTRVIMLTSYTNGTEVIAALASGADAYCVKGSSPDTVLFAIEAALAGTGYLDPLVARQVFDRLKPPGKGNTQVFGTLSIRELEVLRLVVEGMSNQEIADALTLSQNTIKTHVRSIMNKLSVDDRVQAAVKALRAGLV
ncbi:response regulator transcription factor [Leptolyngbya sp. FACHB-261]|uniref:response regulator n=1 Tax=Leptolyngbya sp. FACHB-261 TaxID=2692806 RepID=UPI0016883A20|nr:response regulator transcription factor [Leptolyngbya sp. FACHB-261]MBD2101851.1 response regulator transcription factor [Leptolyngbya sp. FACHB-261]